MINRQTEECKEKEPERGGERKQERAKDIEKETTRYRK